jgi:hypothetical protein
MGPFLTVSSASERYGTSNPLEIIVSTGTLDRSRRRHPTNVGWRRHMSMQGNPSTNQSNTANPAELDSFIREQLAKRLKDSLNGQRAWSFATHGATVLIVIFSATAAVLAQTDLTFLYSSKTWATILSLSVTIISTIQSKLSFDRKWIANRMTHSALVQLDIDLREGTSSKEMAEKLKGIVAKHDQTITSG